MEKIVKTLIDNALEGVDVYFNNGSIWLIFTETKEWVLELEKDGHLWYNHYFFRNLFSYLSMDVVENQKYITKYVEDALQIGVRNTYLYNRFTNKAVEDALQNGVKNTNKLSTNLKTLVEDVLQNGVKYTKRNNYLTLDKVEDVLQNGVKRTQVFLISRNKIVEDVLQNGLKSININTGIKEVKELPDMSGELRGYGDYYRKQKDRVKPHVLYVKDAIEKGLKLK